MAYSISLAFAEGGISVAAHIDRAKTGFELFAEGFQNWKKDIITSAGLFGLEFDDPANFDWYSLEEVGASEAGVRRKIFEERGRDIFKNQEPVV